MFRKNGATILKNGNVLFEAQRKGNLYEVNFEVAKDNFVGMVGNDGIRSTQRSWHSRFGHLNMFDLEKLVSSQMVDGMDQVNMDTNTKFCESCVYGKKT